MLKAPIFWKTQNFISRILVPFSWIYIFISNWKAHYIKPVELSVPVICIGNLVMGGAGKTPTTIAIIEVLKKMGHNPHIISRGYGAIVKELKRVNPSRHNYLQVGDEPLLLANFAPTWVSPNRVKAAKAAIKDGATIVVMDDGFQNNSLFKNLKIIVVDSIQGFGNQEVFPAGPLREPLTKGLKKADAIILIGDGTNKNLPVLNNLHQAYFKPQFLPKNEEKRVVAFAGLGCPEKFQVSLINAGYDIVEFVAYPDHYPYTITEIKKLLKKAKASGAHLVTTSKDDMRIPQYYRKKIDVFKVNLEFEDTSRIEELLNSKILSFEK